MCHTKCHHRIEWLNPQPITGSTIVSKSANHGLFEGGLTDVSKNHLKYHLTQSFIYYHCQSSPTYKSTRTKAFLSIKLGKLSSSRLNRSHQIKLFTFNNVQYTNITLTILPAFYQLPLLYYYYDTNKKFPNEDIY